MVGAREGPAPAIEAIVGSEATLLVAYNAGLGTVRHWMLAPADRGGYYPRDLELVVVTRPCRCWWAVPTRPHRRDGRSRGGVPATASARGSQPSAQLARVLPELVLVPEGQWVDLGFEAVDTDPGQSLSLQWTALGLPAESSLNRRRANSCSGPGLKCRTAREWR